MSFNPDVLDLLVCPVCKTPVRLVADDTGLMCENCRRVYPIQDGVPMMMEEYGEVRPETDE